MPSNELYLAVLPLIHVTNAPFIGFGLTEQVLTLMPGKEFATIFFPDEVDGFINVFSTRRHYLVGGHVTGYDFYKENTDDGRVIVRVMQHVT